MALVFGLLTGCGGGGGGGGGEPAQPEVSALTPSAQDKAPEQVNAEPRQPQTGATEPEASQAENTTPKAMNTDKGDQEEPTSSEEQDNPDAEKDKDTSGSEKNKEDSGSERESSEPSSEENKPPYAYIERMFRHDPGSTVVLDGSFSSDWDNDPLTYHWRLVSKPEGSQAKLSDNNQKQPTFYADLSGQYSVSLYVNDGQVDSAEVTESIYVYPAPVADAGDDQSIELGETVTFDGSNSQGAEGLTLAYSWQIVAAPARASYEYNSSMYTDVMSYKPRYAGTYTFELSVADSVSYDRVSDQVVLTVSAGVSADAGDDQLVSTGATVTLDGRLSQGPITGGRETPDSPVESYRWQLVDAPEDSDITIEDNTEARAQFQADVPGNYDFTLSVTDKGGQSDQDSVRVTVEHPVNLLPYSVVDAEFSKTLNRMVMISASPSALHIYDPVDNSSERIDLALEPKNLSVSPSGDYVAVGHDSKLTYIDLHNRAVEQIFDVPTNIVDVVLSDQGYAYVFPLHDWDVPMYVVNTQTGETNAIEGYGSDLSKTAKLHESGDYIYQLEGDYHDSIMRYSIDGEGVQRLENKSNADRYPYCNRIWLSEDGQRLLSACGVVLKTRVGEDNDLEYNGRLEGTENNVKFSSIQHSQAADRIFALEMRRDQYHYGYEDQQGGRQLRVFRYEFLTETNRVRLPRIHNETGAHYTGGEYVFANMAGTKVYVVVRAEEGSGLLNDYGVVVYSVKDL